MRMGFGRISYCALHWLLCEWYLLRKIEFRLNQCGLMMPYGNTDQGKHYPGKGFCAWRSKALACSFMDWSSVGSLQWRHNGRDSVSNHQPHQCLLSRLFRRKSIKTWKIRVTGLCAGISPVTSEFPAHMASYAENVSIWWRHHDLVIHLKMTWNISDT